MLNAIDLIFDVYKISVGCFGFDKNVAELELVSSFLIYHDEMVSKWCFYYLAELVLLEFISHCLKLRYQLAALDNAEIAAV